jgi:hypothetical protein
MPARGCGWRIAGGVYATWAVDPVLVDMMRGVQPFVFPRPFEVDVQALGISPIGVSMIERNGVWHLLDWIGEVHYQNVGDFIEEATRMGVSRRVPRSLDFSRFTNESRILCVHRHAGGRDRPAIFASFPIHAWQVVRDTRAGRHVPVFDAVEAMASDRGPARNIAVEVVDD